MLRGGKKYSGLHFGKICLANVEGKWVGEVGAEWDPGASLESGEGSGNRGREPTSLAGMLLRSWQALGWGVGRRRLGWHLGSGWGWSTGLEVMVRSKFEKDRKSRLQPGPPPTPAAAAAVPRHLGSTLGRSPRL